MNRAAAAVLSLIFCLALARCAPPTCCSGPTRPPALCWRARPGTATPRPPPLLRYCLRCPAPRPKRRGRWPGPAGAGPCHAAGRRPAAGNRPEHLPCPLAGRLCRPAGRVAAGQRAVVCGVWRAGHVGRRPAARPRRRWACRCWPRRFGAPSSGLPCVRRRWRAPGISCRCSASWRCCAFWRRCSRRFSCRAPLTGRGWPLPACWPFCSAACIELPQTVVAFLYDPDFVLVDLALSACWGAVGLCGLVCALYAAGRDRLEQAPQ